jgi:hypothetical protein
MRGTRDGLDWQYEMQVTSQGDDITADSEGYITTGTLSGNHANLTGETGENHYDMSLEFSQFQGNDHCEGELTLHHVIDNMIQDEIISISGERQLCSWDDGFCQGTPDCTIPVAEITDIRSVAYYAPTAKIPHYGLDFGFVTTKIPTKAKRGPDIIAPCNGVVTRIADNRFSPMPPTDTFFVDVVVKYNREWETLICFEPFSQDVASCLNQLESIKVTVGKTVQKGRPLGQLLAQIPIPDEPPRIHWGVYQIGIERQFICPYDTLNKVDRIRLKELYRGFGYQKICIEN